MKFTKAALAAAVALGTLAVAAPASAEQAQQTAEAKPAKPLDLSAKARGPLVELQKAVQAKDTANIPAKAEAARAVLKTKDDKLVFAQLQLQAASDTKNAAGLMAAADAVGSSGASAAEVVPLYIMIGSELNNLRMPDQAANVLSRAQALDPNNPELLVQIGDIYSRGSRVTEGLALIQKAIGARKASGQPVPQDWYQVAIGRGMKAKSPATLAITKQWVSDYPSPSNWRDTLMIYRQLTPGMENNLDIFRLLRFAHGLTGENDYYVYANAANSRGLPGEAKSVLDEGFAANKIDKSKDIFSQLYATVKAKAAADRPTLASSEKGALNAATAKPAMATADAYMSYGDYAKAAQFYKAALGKSGVDTNLANLRLGEALALSGDKAGATATFNSVTGPNADIAKYWLLYLGKRA